MTDHHIIFIFSILGLTCGAQVPEHSVPFARAHLRNNFINKLHAEICTVQVQNAANMISIFTQGTLEQEQEVARYIQATVNTTKSESVILKMAANSSVDIIDCIHKTELALMQVLLTTYENFDNCVKTTQKGFGKFYTEINAKLDKIKQDGAIYHQQRAKSLENCIDTECVHKVLVPSIVKFEELKEEVSNQVKACNDLNVNYLVINIAKKCVTSAMGQIHHNFNIGKQMMANCFKKQN